VGLLVVDNLPSGRALGPEDAALLLTLASQAALAIQRAQLATALAARAREAEAIAQLGAALAGALDPRALYPRLLATVTSLLPADHACVLLSDGIWCRIAASAGTSLPVRSPVIDLLGPCGEALSAARDETISVGYVADDEVWEDLPLWIGEHRLASLLIVPLLRGDQLLGALVLGSFTPGAFTPEQARLARALGPQAALAMHTVMRRQELRERAFAPLEGGQRAGGIVVHLDDAALAEDLLLLSQAETGKLQLDLGTETIGDLVRRARERATSAEQRVVEQRGPEDLRVIADRRCAAWALAALVDNAARYSPLDASIDLSWTLEGRHAVIRVRDHGAGIRPDEREHLFKKLHRERGAGMGMGLGLYLGRRLVEVQHGALDLEGSGPTGSTFALRLPLVPD
jgi:signal transduction histidine kinase